MFQPRMNFRAVRRDGKETYYFGELDLKYDIDPTSFGTGVYLYRNTFMGTSFYETRKQAVTAMFAEVAFHA